MSGRSRRAAAASAVAVALAAALAACGGADSESAPQASAPDRFFGVVPQTVLAEEDLDRMEQGGVGTIRIVLPWSAVDPSPEEGDLDLSTIDPVVVGAAEHGIRVVPTIFGTPPWVAQDLDGYDCTDDECALYAPRSEKALDAWAEFVGELVDRYGPDGSLWDQNPELQKQPVHDWQIWNEQNSPSFYQPAPEIEGYAALLASAAKVIRTDDPEATIILGGMFATPLQGELPAYTARDYLRQLYEIDGANEDFDAVAAHPYAAHVEDVENQVQLMHNEVKRADDDASMWITEVGWASSGPDVPLNRGPKGQAESLREAFDLFIDKRKEWSIDAVTWYSWRDSAEAVCDWCKGSGLFEETTLEPKPSWDAFIGFTGGS